VLIPLVPPSIPTVSSQSTAKLKGKKVYENFKEIQMKETIPYVVQINFQQISCAIRHSRLNFQYLALARLN
jgi:hypothetical protein